MFPSRRSAYMAKYAKYYRVGYRSLVPALGASRRIQALHAIGYTRAQLMELTGFSKQFLYDLSTSGRNENIARERDEKIRTVYRALCVQPLHKSSGAKKIRTYARKHNWYPPMAWDDIDTDMRASFHARRREGVRYGRPEEQQQATAH